MLVCEVFCNGSKSRFPHCLHYSLPSAREGPCSCLAGGPLAQEVQHAVIWFAKFTCCNALHGLVVHTQEGTKVPPFCIQLVVESFNNVCRQRRGGKDMVLLCCEATAVLPQTHWQCQVVEVVEEGGGWKHQGLVPQRVGRWWHPGRRERKNSKTACFHSHSICTLDIARMVCKQLSVVVRPLMYEGLSQTCRSTHLNHAASYRRSVITTQLPHFGPLSMDWVGNGYYRDLLTHPS